MEPNLHPRTSDCMQCISDSRVGISDPTDSHQWTGGPAIRDILFSTGVLEWRAKWTERPTPRQSPRSAGGGGLKEKSHFHSTEFIKERDSNRRHPHRPV